MPTLTSPAGSDTSFSPSDGVDSYLSSLQRLSFLTGDPTQPAQTTTQRQSSIPDSSDGSTYGDLVYRTPPRGSMLGPTPAPNEDGNLVVTGNLPDYQAEPWDESADALGLSARQAPNPFAQATNSIPPAPNSGSSNSSPQSTNPYEMAESSPYSASTPASNNFNPWSLWKLPSQSPTPAAFPTNALATSMSPASFSPSSDANGILSPSGVSLHNSSPSLDRQMLNRPMPTLPAQASAKAIPRNISPSQQPTYNPIMAGIEAVPGAFADSVQNLPQNLHTLTDGVRDEFEGTLGGALGNLFGGPSTKAGRIVRNATGDLADLGMAGANVVGTVVGAGSNAVASGLHNAAAAIAASKGHFGVAQAHLAAAHSLDTQNVATGTGITNSVGIVGSNGGWSGSLPQRIQNATTALVHGNSQPWQAIGQQVGQFAIDHPVQLATNLAVGGGAASAVARHLGAGWLETMATRMQTQATGARLANNPQMAAAYADASQKYGQMAARIHGISATAGQITPGASTPQVSAHSPQAITPHPNDTLGPDAKPIYGGLQQGNTAPAPPNTGAFGDKPYFLGIVRKYNEPGIPGYAGHHMDAPLGGDRTGYADGPVIDVRNDNAHGTVEGGINVHTGSGGIHDTFDNWLSDQGIGNYKDLSSNDRQVINRRYWASLGIRYPK